MRDSYYGKLPKRSRTRLINGAIGYQLQTAIVVQETFDINAKQVSLFRLGLYVVQYSAIARKQHYRDVDDTTRPRRFVALMAGEFTFYKGDWPAAVVRGQG